MTSQNDKFLDDGEGLEIEILEDDDNDDEVLSLISLDEKVRDALEQDKKS